MIQFSLFRIPVRVLPWFWITMGIIALIHQDQKNVELFKLLLFMLAGFISILVHELGHALTARHFGNQVHIVLESLGGYAAYSGGYSSRFRSILITAAGPIYQIVLGIAAWAILATVEGLSEDGRYFFGVMLLVSFFWALLNLLPVLPLDGGRLLEAILGPQRTRLTLQISITAAIVVAMLCIILNFGFFLPIFMALMAYESYKALKSISWR
jgi:Zn-dependent protease